MVECPGDIPFLEVREEAKARARIGLMMRALLDDRVRNVPARPDYILLD
jgi:hypothetical protein